MILLFFYVSSCTKGPEVPWEITPLTTATPQSLFLKGTNIWFMTIMIAFLMMFIKKYEWGVIVAVLLSVAVSFVTYVYIETFCFEGIWWAEVNVQGIVCGITCSIGIGVFVGTIKYYQYIIVGIFFGASYWLVEWVVLSGDVISGVVDPGGAITVHMFAAYWGLAVASVIREKRVCGAEFKYTTHSVNWVWLASVVLWILWPSFVTAYWTAEVATIGMAACLMAGLGSIVSAFILESLLKKPKFDPVIYTFALLGGCIGISCALFLVGPWWAFLIGVISGVVSVLSFHFLHPVFTRLLGINDIMGVHNLHGVCSWVSVVSGLIACYVKDFPGIWTLYGALISFGIAICTGLVLGVILRITNLGAIPSDELMNDHADFVFIEKPHMGNPIL